MDCNEPRAAWRACLEHAGRMMRDDRGAVMAEYALVMGCCSIVSMIALLAFEQVATTQFESAANNFANSFAQSYGNGS